MCHRKKTKNIIKWKKRNFFLLKSHGQKAKNEKSFAAKIEKKQRQDYWKRLKLLNCRILEWKVNNSRTSSITRIPNHILSSHLDEAFQSGFKSTHSNKTTLLNVSAGPLTAAKLLLCLISLLLLIQFYSN